MDITRLASGPGCTLYALVINDKCLVQEYISSLEKKDQKNIVALIGLISEKGPLTNIQRFRHLRNQIWELKTKGGIRILAFFPDPQSRDLMILTHGFRKPKPKRLEREIDKAIKWQKEYLETFE